MRKAKKILALLLILVMSVSLGACGGQGGSGNGDGDTVYQLRTSTNLAETGTVGKALTKFCELVNEKSEGRINAVANFGAELGSQTEQVEMARTGSLEMVVAAPGTGPGTTVPQLVLFEFPFMFDDNDQYRRMLKDMEDDVTELVRSMGFIAAAGQSQGVRHMLTKAPVTSLEDIKGMKMRGPNNMYIGMFTHLGAAGTTMDWNDIYTGLETNVIDGLEASPSMLNSMKFQDKAKNLAVSSHIIACVYYFFNEEWLNSLPEDLQDVVLECADEAAAYQAQIDDEDQEAALATMIAEGVTVYELPDIDKWRAACEPMREEYRAKGQGWSDFMDAMLASK